MARKVSVGGGDVPAEAEEDDEAVAEVEVEAEVEAVGWSVEEVDIDADEEEASIALLPNTSGCASLEPDIELGSAVEGERVDPFAFSFSSATSLFDSARLRRVLVLEVRAKITAVVLVFESALDVEETELARTGWRVRELGPAGVGD